ncbi:hypothetical protein MNBD_PLANCTO03-19, partial [hydrothermal vent metagenome]
RLTMSGQFTLLGRMLAQITDGAGAWADFVKSAGSALSSNEAFAGMVGLGFVGLVVLFAHWKFAGWLEAVWRRKHKHNEHH